MRPRYGGVFLACTIIFSIDQSTRLKNINKGLSIGRVEHSTMALLIAKMVPDTAQVEDNV
ncbi:hypothetical protein ACTXGJ_10050 [Psychrobacter sp. 1Y11]|uniref:hypothetical protein n=1 Tax=Psychrobacter sp. 1Y11 TaxID=3457446 RepID=UPI003FD6A660